MTGMMTNFDVITVVEEALPPVLGDAINRLIDTTWPPTQPSEPLLTLQMKNLLKKVVTEPSLSSQVVRHVVQLGDMVVAHALTFPRTLIIEGQTLPVMALSAVCVELNLRGNGFGKRVVQDALLQVDGKAYHCALFQTKDPEFYRKLSPHPDYECVTITNTFTNSSAPHVLFHEPSVMAYKHRNFIWPAGTIDLNGAPY